MPLRFSVTGEPQFTERRVPMVPGMDVMEGSVFKDFFDQYPDPKFTGINQVLTPQEQLQLFLNQEGGDVDIEDVNKFAPQGIFSKALDFAQRPDIRAGLGFLFGGLPGGLLSYFAPKIGDGITSLANRFRPAPTVTPMNLNDYTDAGSTTGFGQDISSGDLSSIGDTGFSEYSDPGTAAEYEGSF